MTITDADLPPVAVTSGIFEERESNVRSYCRAFPAVFSTASGALITDEHGRSYIDFLAGAGTLNYGHNEPSLKSALIEYIAQDGLAHGLDLHTVAKERFLRQFTAQILQPRGMNHKVQFTGPTGTNAVEAALKIARKATGRATVFAFMGGYHGHSLGSLAVTANRAHRLSAGTELSGVTFFPYPGGPTPALDTLGYLTRDPRRLALRCRPPGRGHRRDHAGRRRRQRRADRRGCATSPSCVISAGSC